MNKEGKIKLIANEIKNNFSSGQVTDVFNICKQLDIDIIEENIMADAYLECEAGTSYIVLKSSLNSNRKKYTIAHELGHFFIPWHSELMFGCDIKEMNYDLEYLPKEKEANMFAAELLMPTDQFKRYYNGLMGYNVISSVAQYFDVSFYAALSRCIDYCKEDCMVVCSSNRKIIWKKATECFPLLINRNRVSNQSVAEELFDMNVFYYKKTEEPSYVWFSNEDDVNIIEESIMFPNYNQVISIIHLKDDY